MLLPSVVHSGKRYPLMHALPVAPRIVVLCLLLLAIASMAFSETVGAAWANKGWAYRMPIQVRNLQNQSRAGLVLSLDDLPFLPLLSERKLTPDGRDLRLVDENGGAIPLRIEHITSDNGDARCIFQLDTVPANARRKLWLYYGNPLAKPTTILSEDAVPAEPQDLNISLGAEEGRDPLPTVEGKSLASWLAEHRLIEAEQCTGAGFTVQQPTAATAPWTNGKFQFAGGTDNDTLTLDADVDNGEATIWVRCSAALPGYAPQGSMTATVVQKDLELIKRTINMQSPKDAEPAYNMSKTNSDYRWLPLPFIAVRGKVRLTISSANSHLAVDCFIITGDMNYRPDIRDFRGQIWVRWRIDKPADYVYWGKIHHELNPYLPTFKLSGSVSAFGLQPDQPALPYTEDTDYLHAGQYSPWVLLPTSTAAQWHSVLFFTPKSGKPPAGLTARVEFANRPSPSHIFHAVNEPLELGSATMGVLMPRTTTLEGLQQLETFTEWAQRRMQLVEKLQLSPPPHLKKLLVGTWISMATRLGGGTVPAERAELDFKTAEALGINMMMAFGVDDQILAEAAKKHGFVNTTWTAWADSWRYTAEARDKVYDYQEGETPPQHWQRVFTDYYAKLAASAKKNAPFASSFARNVNLGDEIAAATNVEEIRKTPQILAYFRQWLQGQGITPAQVGATAWNDVLPVDDRQQLDAKDDVTYARLFYFSRQFMNHYSVIYYRAATEQAKQLFPQAELIGVNYQAGPMQFGYIGNDNDMNKGMLDLFMLSHDHAFHGVMTEDWVPGWDAGIGRICFGAEIMRAAARKQNLPMASFLIGGEAIRAKYFAYLMHGVKENGLYLYGPITNIGPAWAESEKALTETAEVTRTVKKMEDAIAAGAVRPRKAAMLVATTSDILQKKGLYFCPERQALYTALKHSYTPVDVVTEQEIVEDDILKNYTLLYITDPQVRADAQAKIADWVHGGGRLWASIGAADWDEASQPCAILNPVFGVDKREMVTQDNWLKWAAAFYGRAVSKFAYTQVGTLRTSSDLFGPDLELPVWGAKLECTPTTAQIRGIYEDGKPAILLNRYGKGQALLIGALVGEAYMRLHYPDDGKNCGKSGWSFEQGEQAQRLANALLKSAGVQRPLSLSLPGIYTSVMDSPQGTLVFLNNATLATDTDFTHAQQPTVTAWVHHSGVQSVVSAKYGPLKKVANPAKLGPMEYAVQNGLVVFKLTLPNADVLLLKH